MMEKPDTHVCIPADRSQMVLERLQSTLNRAFRNVPFHRQRLQEEGIDPSDIQSLDDIERLPFTTRQHLSENYPYGLFAVPLRDIVRIHTAPGTTANPTVSGYTRQDLGIWESMVATALRSSGVTPDDILQISLDPGLDTWGRDYQSGAESLGASVIPNTLMSIEKQLMVMRDYKPSTLVTTVSYAQQLAAHMENKGLDPNAFSLKKLILVGEPAGAGQRDFLEDKLQVRTWQHFGLSEVPGPALAYECETRSCLHVNDDHFLPEIIDPATGEAMPVGQVGELVLTTLTTRAYPLIRFRTGDMARILPDACPCDCRLVRIEWRPERSDRLLRIRGVKVHEQQILSGIEKALGMPPRHACMFENRYREKIFLEIWIAVDKALFSDEIKMLEARMKTVRDQVQEDTGVPVVVRLKERASIDACKLAYTGGSRRIV
jgi:phenylacetate-CoA ligase